MRNALLRALARDSNPGVRLKAVEGLRTLTNDVDIRQALARALQADDNPGVRIQVIQILTQHPDDSMVGVFQNLIEKDDNNYVRLRCQRALREMNASEGTF